MSPRSHPSDATVYAALGGMTLPTPPWTTLGSGVWGDVFDLHDGSVLKMVRFTGGIGSGTAIHTGETTALAAAAGLGAPVTAARLIASSAIDLPAHGLADYCGWIRMSKLPGETVSSILARRTDAPSRAALMRRLGEATAALHRQSGHLIEGKPPMPPVSQERLAQIADIVPDMRTACMEVASVLAAGPQHPFLHGDINGGNALLTDADAIDECAVGLVDWGEAQSGPVEIDLRHMHDIGGPAEAMMESYETTSGMQLDPTRLAAALCMNALGTLAIATLGTVEGLDPSEARQAALSRLAAVNHAGG